MFCVLNLGLTSSEFLYVIIIMLYNINLIYSTVYRTSLESGRLDTDKRCESLLASRFDLITIQLMAAFNSTHGSNVTT